MINSATHLEGNARQSYRKLLLNKKTELLAAFEITSHRLAGEVHESGADPVQVLQEESVSVLLNLVLYGQLREVAEALERLDLGKYGVCLGCGDSISPKRLQSVPWTRHCLLCQEKARTSQPPELIGVGERG